MTKKLTPQEAGLLGGAPTKPIDYKQLDTLCAIHCTGEECAAILRCSYEHLNNTLKKDGHGGFLDYFKEKSSNGKASLRRRQYKLAEDGNATMLIWLGKQWLGQKEPESKQHITFDDVTPEQRKGRISELLGKCKE